MRINVNMLKTTSLCFYSLYFLFHSQGLECFAVETDVQVEEFLLPMNRNRNDTGLRARQAWLLDGCLVSGAVFRSGGWFGRLLRGDQMKDVQPNQRIHELSGYNWQNCWEGLKTGRPSRLGEEGLPALPLKNTSHPLSLPLSLFPLLPHAAALWGSASPRPQCSKGNRLWLKLFTSMYGSVE